MGQRHGSWCRGVRRRSVVRHQMAGDLPTAASRKPAQRATIEEHQAILRAIEARDPEAARAASETHLDSVLHRIEEQRRRTEARGGGVEAGGR